MAEDGRIAVSESGYEKRGPKGVLHSFGSFLGRIFSALWYCFLWCVRWGWNCIMIMTAFFGGLCCMVLLFLFAMLLVWLVQGYPLAGVTLACFGGCALHRRFYPPVHHLPYIKEKERQNGSGRRKT